MHQMAGSGSSHPNDRFIRNVALVAVSSLLVIYIYTGAGQREKAWCWTPAYFTPEHSSYVHAVCSSPYAAYIRELIPRAWNISSISTHQKSFFVYFLVGELIVSCLAAICFKNIFSCTLPYVHLLHSAGDQWMKAVQSGETSAPQSDNPSGVADLASSHGIAFLYFLTQLGWGAVWFAFGAASYKLEAPRKYATVPYFCDFKITEFGNTHIHTAQCISETSDTMFQLAVTNLLVCLLICVMMLFHLIYMFILYSVYDQAAVRYLVEKQSVPQIKANFAGFMYRFSDLYMVSMAAALLYQPDVRISMGNSVTTAAGTTQGQGGSVCQLGPEQHNQPPAPGLWSIGPEAHNQQKVSTANRCRPGRHYQKLDNIETQA